MSHPVDTDLFNAEIKRQMFSKTRTEDFMNKVTRSNAVISHLVKEFVPNDGLEHRFRTDIQACSDPNEVHITHHLGSVECWSFETNDTIDDKINVFWVRIDGRYVYRRASQISQQVETSTVLTCGLETPHIDDLTSLLCFPQRGTHGQYCNAPMKKYELQDCTMQYGNNFEPRANPLHPMHCIQYPHGGCDIYVVRLSGDYNVMILSKPLVFQKKYSKSTAG
jgi:hypothetical protein